MKEFTDNFGRVWPLEINVSTVKRVREMLKVDLLDTKQNSGVQQLLGDTILLCDTLYVICKPHADKEKISDEDFGRGLGGDAIWRAMSAFKEELVNFFPNPKERETIRKAIQINLNLEDRVLNRIGTVLDEEKLAETVDKMMNDAIAQSPVLISGNSSGKRPDSSESTLDRSR